MREESANVAKVPPRKEAGLTQGAIILVNSWA